MIMGDTNRVNCAQCGTSYDRHFLLGKQGALNVCPMCGAFISLSSDEEESFSHEDEPDFDEEFNNPDLYFYDIDSEDEFAVVCVLYCMWLASCTCNDLIVFGLVCWPGEASHCLHLFEGGTVVVLIVELVER